MSIDGCPGHICGLARPKVQAPRQIGSQRMDDFRDGIGSVHSGFCRPAGRAIDTRRDLAAIHVNVVVVPAAIGVRPGGGVPAIAGGAAGRVKGNRHLRYPDHTPMANLLLTMLDRVGVREEKLGDSTGMFTEL